MPPCFYWLNNRTLNNKYNIPTPQIERIRTLSECAQQLTAAHDKDAGRLLSQASMGRLWAACCCGCVLSHVTCGLSQRSEAAGGPAAHVPRQLRHWLWLAAVLLLIHATQLVAATAAVQGQQEAFCSGTSRQQRWKQQHFWSSAVRPICRISHAAVFVATAAQKMAEELFALPLEEALPIVRAFGHYLK